MKKIAEQIEDIKVPLMWKVNTPSLLKEVLNNPTCWMLATPLQIFSGILQELGRRAIELKDDKLNAILCRLALFEEADPYSKEFDREKVNALLEKVYGKPKPRRVRTPVNNG